MQANTLTATPTEKGSFWQWLGEQIYYVRAGVRHPQRPPLLLVHGFGGSTDHWRKNIADLQEDFEVWAIDLVGFGRSAKPQWQYSGDLWRQQLTDFITDVIGAPPVLVGNSLGGYASLCVAASNADIPGVVLLNSAGPFTPAAPPPEPPPMRRAIQKAAKWLFQQNLVSWLLFHWTRRRSVIRKTLEKVYLDKTAVTDQLVEDIYRPSCDPGAAGVFASVFKTPQGEKVDVLLGQMTCPLLTLWGEGDPWMNVKERSAQFRQHYSQLTEYYLQAGHCPHDEIPQRVNQLIRDWVLGFSN